MEAVEKDEDEVNSERFQRFVDGMNNVNGNFYYDVQSQIYMWMNEMCNRVSKAIGVERFDDLEEDDLK